MPDLHSRHIVDQMEIGIKERTDRLWTPREITPTLEILSDNPDYAASLKYMKLKEKTGEKLGIQVAAWFVSDRDELVERIEAANIDDAIHAIVVQLPLKDREGEDEILAKIAGDKDVDGLGPNSDYSPATPAAILRLLDGYDIDYVHEPVAVFGAGKLVGKPLLKLLQKQGAESVQGFDHTSTPLEMIDALNKSHVIVSAMGQPHALASELFVDPSIPRVIIDAGAAERDGKVRGDVSDELRELGLGYEWLVTPEIGGVGYLTVRTLLSNVVTAAELQSHNI